MSGNSELPGEISKWLNRDVTGLSTEYLIFDLCQLNQYIGEEDALGHQIPVEVVERAKRIRAELLRRAKLMDAIIEIAPKGTIAIAMSYMGWEVQVWRNNNALPLIGSGATLDKALRDAGILADDDDGGLSY